MNALQRPNSSQRQSASNRTRRAGLTLFEVLLALVIFVGALTAIGRLLSSGVQGALHSRFQLQATQLCQAKMGEVVCGALPLKNATGTYPEDPAWSWSLQVVAAPVSGLMLAEVSVQRASQNKQAELKFSMVRYVRDPAVYLAAEEEAERNAQEQEQETQ